MGRKKIKQYTIIKIHKNTAHTWQQMFCDNLSVFFNVYFQASVSVFLLLSLFLSLPSIICLHQLLASPPFLSCHRCLLPLLSRSNCITACVGCPQILTPPSDVHLCPSIVKVGIQPVWSDPWCPPKSWQSLDAAVLLFLEEGGTHVSLPPILV